VVFLEENHYFRHNKSSFDSKVEHWQALKLHSRSDLLNQIQGFDFKFGKSQPRKERKEKREKSSVKIITLLGKKGVY